MIAFDHHWWFYSMELSSALDDVLHVMQYLVLILREVTVGERDCVV